MAEKVILVGLNYQDGPKDSQDSIIELARLAETAGGVVCWSKIFSQVKPFAALFIGTGQAKEVQQQIQANQADLVIVDHELKPSQQRNLEEEMQIPVIDRTQLILDIFAQRAQSYEGKLQVELAQLSYLLPRLVGQGMKLSRLGGGIGTRGPGETKLEEDRRRLRNKIATLKGQLEGLKRTRQVQRHDRQNVSVPLISLVGYTNAGKSAILRLLTGEETLIEDQLFATLDLTTRRMLLPPNQEALLTDTVGFIRRLPHHLVAAFRSTLEEVNKADLLLKVVDCSDRVWKDQLKTVDEVLKDLKVEDKPYLLVFNKIDKIGHATKKILHHQFPESVQLSALTTDGREKLLEKIKKTLAKQWKRVTLRLDYAQSDLRALLLKRGRLIRESFGPEMISMTIELPEQVLGQLKRLKKDDHFSKKD